MQLVHPFPSILDGLVVGAVAAVAGGGADTALRLAVSMTALQCSIGALNDIVDAPADAGRVPPKPIPSGLVSLSAAWVVTLAAACLGTVVAATIGVGVAVLSLIALVVGYAYDLLAKGTAWSWLPFAVGIPILPVYGWYGATGSLPAFFSALVPMGVLAGTALAIGNARSDLDTDRAAMTGSIATALGDEVAWRAQVVALTLAVAIAIGWLIALGAGMAGIVAAGAASGVLVLTALASRGAGRHRRWAWEIQAVAVAVALVVWLAGLPPAGPA